MNNKFWSFILIVIWLFILVLFTKDQVFDLQYVSAERETLISKREQKTKEHSNLSNISKEIKKWEIKELDKYSTPLKEGELLEFVYKVVDKINSTWTNKVTINNLSLTNAKLNNMQFLESNVNLSLTVPNEKKLTQVIKELMEAKQYKFFITNLSYNSENAENKDNQSSDLSSVSQGFQVVIPLKVFYNK